MKEQEQDQKPDWKDAPEWALSLGICVIPGEFDGMWCWCKRSAPQGFFNVEQRPV